jgi:hypothetical protein
MDPLTVSVVTLLGKYALDKGAALGKAVGPQALETARSMFGMVVAKVRQTDPRTADTFPSTNHQAPSPSNSLTNFRARPDLHISKLCGRLGHTQIEPSHPDPSKKPHRGRAEADVCSSARNRTRVGP